MPGGRSEGGRQAVPDLDRCPYAGRALEDCVAFEPLRYEPQTSRFEPLPAVVTCRHLKVGTAADRGRFYPLCELGGERQRIQHAAALGRQVGGGIGPSYKLQPGYVARLLSDTAGLHRDTMVLLQRSAAIQRKTRSARLGLRLEVLA
jgi:hypothetical protein